MNENLHRGLAAPGDIPMAEELALLGHDIRSALTDVMAALAMIDDHHLAGPDRQQLARAKASAGSLVGYLKDGLAMLLTESPLTLDHAHVDIAEMLQDLTRRYCYFTGQNPNAVIIASANLPAMITCNRTALDRILSNLVSNAITHSGGQTIRLTVTQPAPDQICFSVTDQGPGFPDQIGERTRKGSAENSALPAWHTDEGHGLGLSIAHILAQRMGATLDLRNHDGGAIAALTLPIDPVADCNPAPSVETSCLIGKQVLIAEDSTPQLLLLDKFLRDCGAKTTMMRDGAAAENALLAGNFDLALIDLEMPGRTGLQICTALRDRHNQSGTQNGTQNGKLARIVILTAHHLPEIHQTALAAGATQVLVKPITSAHNLATALCSAPGQAPTNPPAPRDTTAFDRLLEMAGPELATELLARYQDDLTTVQTNLCAALPPLDWPTLCAASHVLIGLAGTAGDTTLEHNARTFNTAANSKDSGALSLQKDAVLDGLADLLTHLHQIEQERQRT